MAREPSAEPAPGAFPGCGGGASRNSTVGVKKSVPVTAVEKSSTRSVLPGGSPMNMLRNIRSVTAGVRE